MQRQNSNRFEGDHDDEKFFFKSRRVEKVLLEAAFDPRGYRPWPENHPMRYWAIAGWGPVPAALRAPEGIYRELELVNPSDLYQEIQLPDANLWLEKHHHQNIIFVGKQYTKVGEAKWVAVTDVRDDTTVENLRIPPQGRDAIVCSHEELKTFRPPIDTATGREYIEMTSGDFSVSAVPRYQGRVREVARVGNAAVGKWFWELYPRHGEADNRRDYVFHDEGTGTLSQLVVWYESVHDHGEYRIPLQSPEKDVIKRFIGFVYNDDVSDWSSLPPLNQVQRARRENVSAVVETFLRMADTEKQLNHAMEQFMTEDPNGLWWKLRELADGFWDSWFLCHPTEVLLVGQLGCEKLCFANDKRLFDSISPGSARTMIGGCVRKTAEDEELMRLHFKLSHTTGKIVAMRALFG